MFLHLSDIHFDPFDVGSDIPGGGVQGLVDKLVSKGVAEWEGVFATYKLNFPNTGAGNIYVDANYPLLVSALQAASRNGTIDYVIHTGDYLRHDFVSTSETYITDPKRRIEFTAHAVEFVNLMIRKYVKGPGQVVPLVGTLGNNDSACNDYQLSPPDAAHPDTVDKPFLDGVGGDLLANDPAALASFRKGGYYVIPHPNPNVKNHDFVVLSTFWSYKFADQCGAKKYGPACTLLDPSDDTPGGVTLCWLDQTLKAEEQAGRTVTLLMHIPPGIDEYADRAFWAEKYNAAFASVTANHGKILRDGYAGHTHDDEFRILADGAGSPYLVVHMAPSLSPWRGTLPAFTIFVYDTASGHAADYATYHLQGGSQGNDPNAAQWDWTYTFSAVYGTYGIDKYDPAQFKALAGQIDRPPYDAQNKVCGDFFRYFDFRDAPGNCSRSKACALNNISASAYATCTK